MRRIASLAVTSALALALITATAADAGQPQAVFATKAHEFGQSAVNGAIAWAVDRPAEEFTYAIKVKLGAASAFRVNPPKTAAQMGGLDLGNPLANVLLAYSRARAIRQKQWDIHLYDVETQMEIPVPAGLNTDSKREASPTVSGDYLLFERGPQRSPVGTKIVLYQISTTDSTLLANAPSGGIVQAGQVSGDYATYTVCPRSNRCSVFRYRISDQQRLRAPDQDRAAYDPSVTNAGIMFYALGSPRYCGYKTKLMRWDGGGAATTVVRFDNGIELGPSSAHVEPDSDEIVHFTRIACRGFNTDIYKVKV